MIRLDKNQETYTIQFSKDDLPEDFFNKLLKKVAIENTLKKSKATEKDTVQLSEDIKEEWWNNNKEWILKQINT